MCEPTRRRPVLPAPALPRRCFGPPRLWCVRVLHSTRGWQKIWSDVSSANKLACVPSRPNPPRPVAPPCSVPTRNARRWSGFWIRQIGMNKPFVESKTRTYRTAGLQGGARRLYQDACQTIPLVNNHPIAVQSFENKFIENSSLLLKAQVEQTFLWLTNLTASAPCLWLLTSGLAPLCLCEHFLCSANREKHIVQCQFGTTEYIQVYTKVGTKLGCVLVLIRTEN